MQPSKLGTAAVGFLVVSICGAALHAQPAKSTQPAKTQEKAAPPAANAASPTSATIEKIMDQAVRNIAVRYNLNDNQRQITNKLMKAEVYKFLREHESDVWPTIRDLLGTAWGTKPPTDTDSQKSFGKSARPIARFAKEAIISANAEWRLILTDQQKRMHDFDMDEMETTFDKIDTRLAQWEEGKASGKGLFPQNPVTPGTPPRPTLPKDVASEYSSLGEPGPIMESLVENFIKEFGLNEGQVTAARSILEEYKEKANDYKLSKKPEFAAVATAKQAAMAAADLTAVKEAHAQHNKLLKPILELCEQMREQRLMRLLTTAQIQKHAEGERSPDKPKRAAKTVSAKTEKADSEKD